LSPVRLVILVCSAQVLAQIGSNTWPALLPELVEKWQLSNSEAGWITGLMYLAYTISVPILVTSTDRIDPKRVYLLGVGLSFFGHLGFALFADGFWTAALFRAIAGIGWAGTYMTGLKLLADRVDGRLLSRATAGHAGSIGVAAGVSFVFADAIAGWGGWQAAFYASAACAALAWAIAWFGTPWQEPKPRSAAKLFDFGPVFRNRSAMAYGLAYCVHTWEMNALRGWAVAFLAWVALTTETDTGWFAPTAVAMTMALLGTATSMFGNEMSIRLGRQRLVRLAMTLSILCAATIGFFGPTSYAIAVAFVLGYGVVIWLDSSSLTAGAAGAADPDKRGATLAIHSMLGYGGGFVGPLSMGFILDWSGGMSVNGWGYAFAGTAIVLLAGRIAFTLLRPRDLAGDRAAIR
jgi:predicted MFS family arabinose efflux permease